MYHSLSLGYMVQAKVGKPGLIREFEKIIWSNLLSIVLMGKRTASQSNVAFCRMSCC